MLTINFTIHVSFVESYIANRGSMGGVMVAAVNEETKEAGWLYICHAGSLRPAYCNKARWIVSCWLPNQYEQKSPWEGGNRDYKIKTTLTGNSLLCQPIHHQLGQMVECTLPQRELLPTHSIHIASYYDEYNELSIHCYYYGHPTRIVLDDGNRTLTYIERDELSGWLESYEGFSFSLVEREDGVLY